MDKHEFEKFKKEMTEVLFKATLDAIQFVKDEIGNDDESEGYNEEPENSSAEEHENPHVTTGDWIVFDGELTDEMDITLTEPFRITEDAYGYTGFYNHGGDFIPLNHNKYRKHHTGRYRLATDREIMFAEAGRDVNEFRVNDLVVDEQWGKAFVIGKQR